jgi:hypothetical protein
MHTFRIPHPLSRLAIVVPLSFALQAYATDRDGSYSDHSYSKHEGSGPRFDAFADFAGSERNLHNLVTGLRYDRPVTLTQRDSHGDGSKTTFDPPTKPMGWGNVRHALTLARAELHSVGIDHPTPQQLAAAMNGGRISTPHGTVRLQGVLQLRSSGMGWGQIRQELSLPSTAFSQGALHKHVHMDAPGKHAHYAHKPEPHPHAYAKPPQAHAGAGITTAHGTPPDMLRARYTPHGSGPDKVTTAGKATSNSYGKSYAGARPMTVSMTGTHAGIVTASGSSAVYGHQAGGGKESDVKHHGPK